MRARGDLGFIDGEWAVDLLRAEPEPGDVVCADGVYWRLLACGRGCGGGHERR